MTGTRKYDLLAVDLDGTLLGRDSCVSARNAAAIAAAREAGMAVTVCTGRGLVECRPALEAIAQSDAVVVAGGAIIACPRTSRTLHRFSIERELVAESVAHLHQHELAALVLKDPLEAGYDYLVVRGRGGYALDPVTEWWFGAMSVRVRYVDHLDEDEHPEHTVRVGACGFSNRLGGVGESLKNLCIDRAIVHAFPAVVGPGHDHRIPVGESLHILELFHRDASKWSAVSRIAEQLDIAPARIAAIGDEINDLSMMQNAGLGIAMGNAVPSIRQAAKRHTLRNDEDGVAHAVEQILSGAW